MSIYTSAVIDEIAKVLLIRIDENSRIDVTPGWTSLATVDILLACEERFEVLFPVEVLQQLTSVKSIVHQISFLKDQR